MNKKKKEVQDKTRQQAKNSQKLIMIIFIYFMYARWDDGESRGKE